MIQWSPTKLKLTLGIGSLGGVAILSELSQKTIPAWLAVGIVILPLAVFVFADPDDVPRFVARLLQIGASLWYLVVNSFLAAWLVSGGPKAGWWLMLAFLVIGAIPCLIVIARAVVSAPHDEIEGENESRLPSESPFPSVDFSQPAVYRPKMGTTLLLLLACCLFVAGGVWMIQEGQLMGWLVAAFFGLGLIVIPLQLVPSFSFLKVSSSGIEIRSLWRCHEYKWSDISHFYTGCVGKNKMVLIAFAPSYQQAQTARKVARALSGAEGALPDTYGFTAEALAEYLNAWKAAHARVDA